MANPQSTSNTFRGSTAQRTRRRRKRHILQQRKRKPVEESDSDYVPPVSCRPSYWDPSPKKKVIPSAAAAGFGVKPRFQVRPNDPSSYSDEDEDDGDDDVSSVDEGDEVKDEEEEEERIFVKQDNGQFIALRPSQVVFHKESSS